MNPSSGPIEPPPPKRRQSQRTLARKGARWDTHTHAEILEIVAKLLIEGKTNRELVAHMHDAENEPSFTPHHLYHLEQEIWSYLTFKFSFDGRDRAMGASLQQAYPTLKAVVVVCGVTVAPFAIHAATHIIDSIDSWLVANRADERAVYRIGLYGGRTIKAIMQALSEALIAIDEDKKRHYPKLIFHALSGATSLHHISGPSQYFAYFENPLLAPLDIEFVDFAPLHPAFGAVRAQALGCNLVLTSIGDFHDEHSVFGSLRLTNLPAWEELRQAQCVGDLAQLPVSSSGPLSLHLPPSALQLRDLRTMLKSGSARVMAFVTPCCCCGQPKLAILKTLMALLQDSAHQLFSDLLIDRWSATHLLRPTIYERLPPRK